MTQDKMLERLLRKYNFRGKHRLVDMLFSKSETIVVPYLHDSLIEINTDELIGKEIFWHGGYEKEVMWILDHMKISDGVCLDLGANIGVWSVPMGKLFQKIYCVEPHPEFRRRLLNNLSLNGIRNAVVHDCALGTSEGKVTLYAPPLHMKNKSASILELNDELTEHIEVNIRSIDELFREVDRVDFIKIDCDGSDGDIILSGRSLIESCRPVVLFEDLGGYHSSMGSPDLVKQVDDDYDAAYQLLISLGYRIFEIGDERLTETQRPRGRYSNILAIPNCF